MYWHVYCHAHWFDVAAETLRTIRDAGFAAPVEAHVTGSPRDIFDLQDLAGRIGSPVGAVRHSGNAFEFHALHALWRACREGLDRAFYIHTKGVTNICPTATRWRWLMLDRIVARWRDRLTDLESYDAVGCCYLPHWPAFAGNFWAARGDWLRSRPEPRPSADRFSFERWLLQGGGARVKSLVSVADRDTLEPYRADFHYHHPEPYLLPRDGPRPPAVRR